MNLKDLSEKKKTKTICLSAIKQNASMINYIPQRYRTDEFYLEAMKVNHLVFPYVPREHKTDELMGEQMKIIRNKRKEIESKNAFFLKGAIRC